PRDWPSKRPVTGLLRLPGRSRAARGALARCGGGCVSSTRPPPARGRSLPGGPPVTHPTGAQCGKANTEHLQAAFLQLLPRIQTHAEIHFRHLRCPGKRDDAIQEVTALAWKWFLRLAEQGKDVTQFVSAVAEFAVRQVRCGRKLCGQERSRDAMNPVAQA